MRLLLAGLIALMLTGCSEKDLRRSFEILSASAEEIPLGEEEVVQALKDALARGISLGSASAAVEGAYLNNPKLKIETPPDFATAEKTLRKIGLGGEIDRFVAQLNRSAELAAARAKPIFIRAITSMSISDGFEILNGAPDAATRYLERNTRDDLFDAFLPVVQDTLDQTSATRYYEKLASKYNELPLNWNVDPDLDGYATRRAIDGLFVLIAEEEVRIRADPAARTTRLLRRVFGSLD